MQEVNEYMRVLQALYEKSLFLQDPGSFHPLLKFLYEDALAHLDYSISVLAYNPDSPRNMLSRDYLKMRRDIAETGDQAKIPGFMNWIEEHSPDLYELFPLFIQKIFSSSDPARYRSFCIVLNPDIRSPFPASQLRMMVDEMFEQSFLNILYHESRLSIRLEEYLKI